MTTRRSLFVVALLGGFTSFATVGAEENAGLSNSPAPEATASEATLSFWDIAHLEEAFIDAAPADRKDALVVGELGVDGGDKDMLVKLAEEIARCPQGQAPA